MTPLSTLILSVSVALISLCAIFTGPSSFQLVPMSTVPDVEGLHHRKCIATEATPCCSHVAHITILGVPGWHQLITNGPICGYCSTLVATQDCKFVARQEGVSHVLLYQKS